MHLSAWWTLVFLVIGLNSGCKQQEVFYSKSYEAGSWQSDAYFQFDHIPVVDDAELVIVVAHDEEYGYENLYVNTLVILEGDTIKNEVFSIDLMTDEGVWSGKHLGGSYEIEYTLKDSTLSLTAPFEVHIAQHSREEVLPGIKSIAVVLRAPVHQ